MFGFLYKSPPTRNPRVLLYRLDNSFSSVFVVLHRTLHPGKIYPVNIILKSIFICDIFYPRLFSFLFLSFNWSNGKNNYLYAYQRYALLPGTNNFLTDP